MKKIYLLLLIIHSTVLLIAVGVWAQEKERIERDKPSRYFLGKEEQMLLPVNILGLVQKPGQYMVPFRTDLISLIAYAGGFREDAKINDIKIVRSAGTNGNNKARARVFTVDVKRYFELGDQTQIPQLMPDDTIIVTGKAGRTVDKFFDFMSKVTILANLAFYIAVIVR